MNDQWIKKELMDKAYSCCFKHECQDCPYNHVTDRNNPEYIHQSFKQIYCYMIRDMIDAEREKIIQGVKSCIMDRDCVPNCKECPYSIDGEKNENNTTNVRCCDVLKKDVLQFLENIKITQ